MRIVRKRGRGERVGFVEERPEVEQRDERRLGWEEEEEDRMGERGG